MLPDCRSSVGSGDGNPDELESSLMIQAVTATSGCLLCLLPLHCSIQEPVNVMHATPAKATWMQDKASEKKVVGIDQSA